MGLPMQYLNSGRVEVAGKRFNGTSARKKRLRPIKVGKESDTFNRDVKFSEKSILSFYLSINLSKQRCSIFTLQSSTFWEMWRIDIKPHGLPGWNT